MLVHEGSLPAMLMEASAHAHAHAQWQSLTDVTTFHVRQDMPSRMLYASELKLSRGFADSRSDATLSESDV